MNQAQMSLLKCLNCEASGVLNWQEGSDQTSSRRTLVSVTGDFHIETGRTVPNSRVLVCTQCDEIYGALPIGRLPLEN